MLPLIPSLCAASIALFGPAARPMSPLPPPSIHVASLQGTTGTTERAIELATLLAKRSVAAIEAFIDDAIAERLRVGPHRQRMQRSLAAMLHETGGAAQPSVRLLSEREAELRFFAPLPEDWVTVRLVVEPDAPYRIAGFSGVRVDRSERLAARFDATPASVQAYLRRLASADRYSGVVQVSRGDSVHFADAVGMQSREHGVPMQVGTRLSIGSVGKMFTATAILQLVEEGRLSLTSTVAEVLPGVLRDDVASRVQVQHLLTHTSGLGDFLFTPEMWGRARDRFRTVADYLPMLADDTLTFTPGTRWAYSNAGFLVLGAILEKLSGQPFDAVVEARVFARAGMTETGAPALDRVPVGLASGYEIEFEGADAVIVSDRFTQVAVGTPAGGGFSTVEDLRRFVRALRDGRLLGPDLRRAMLTPKPELGAPDYGYGVQMFSADGSVVGHTGGGPGTSAHVEFEADGDLTTISLGNLALRQVSVLRRLQALGEASR